MKYWAYASTSISYVTSGISYEPSCYSYVRHMFYVRRLAYALYSSKRGFLRFFNSISAYDSVLDIFFYTLAKTLLRDRALR